MKLSTAIVIFTATIANANGKRHTLRRELEESISMSMPEAIDVEAMKGSTGGSRSGKSGKSEKQPPTGAAKFVGLYSDPINHAGGTREIELTGDTNGDYQFAEVIGVGGVDDAGVPNEPANFELPAVALGDRKILIDFTAKGAPDGFKNVPGELVEMDGSITFPDGNRWPRISPCLVCPSSDSNLWFPEEELSDDLTIQAAFVIDDDDSSKSLVCFRLVRQGEGWVGIGINQDSPYGMVAADAVIGLLDDGEGQPQSVLKYKLNGKSLSAVKDGRMDADKQTLMCPSITYDEKRGETTLQFAKYFKETDDEYEILPTEVNNFVFAYGDLTLGYHGRANRGKFEYDCTNITEVGCAFKIG